MKREDEELAKMEFDRLLKNILGVANLKWTEVEQDEEPPDYYLEINSNKYAVEVTSIWEMFVLGTRSFSSIAISAFLSRFIDNIEHEACSKGILRGAYEIWFSPVENFQDKRDELKHRILEYIASTQRDPKAPKLTLFKDDNMSVAIQKLHDEKNYVEKAISYPAKWEGECIVELTDEISKTLSVKKKKLELLQEPKIILLYDAFNYLDETHWQEIVCDSQERDSFYAICRVSPATRTSLLFSQDAGWLTNPA